MNLLISIALLIAIVTAARGTDDYIEDISRDDGGDVDMTSQFEPEDNELIENQENDDDGGSGVRPPRPYRACMRELKKCYASKPSRNWVDKHTCRLGFCECRKRVCENYFDACQSSPLCSLKQVCAKSFDACKYRPRKESKCINWLRRCLKRSIDNQAKTKKCMQIFDKCVTKRG